MKRNQSGFGATPIILLAFVAFLVAGAGIYVTNNDHPDPKPIVKEQKTSDSSLLRDTTRKQHAATFATRLFNVHLVLKQGVTLDQAGLDKLQQSEASSPIVDPQTKKPYVFAENQSLMKVGEASFGLSATCDNKVSGFDGDGLIVTANAGSVAVAVKLESGLFACESNL